MLRPEHGSFLLLLLFAWAAPVCATDAQSCCGPGCRVESIAGALAHYDKAYFAWQAKLGMAKARGNWRKQLRLRANETVLDFGAGSGAILGYSNVARIAGHRIAVEYSDVARSFMKRTFPAIELHKYPESVRDGSVDLVYSTSVIEHVECPIQELRELRRKLRVGGRIAIGIKNEGVELWKGWKFYDKDNHLYTWNSQLLGNVLRAAGFYVDELYTNAADEAELEAGIVASGFGRQKHVFQYLWAFGHRPRSSEPWPQNGTLGQPTVNLTTSKVKPRREANRKRFWLFRWA